VPEDVLARITGSVVRGLRFLKDELQIIHRDVKPTNVLVNTRGQIKLCDFGCQSYMAVSYFTNFVRYR
jgi:mitogen-activated protein kinase kinase